MTFALLQSAFKIDFVLTNNIDYIKLESITVYSLRHHLETVVSATTRVTKGISPSVTRDNLLLL